MDNPYFRLLGTDSKTAYVDLPNSSISEIVGRLQVAYNSRDDLDKMLKEVYQPL